MRDHLAHRFFGADSSAGFFGARTSMPTTVAIVATTRTHRPVGVGGWAA